MHKNTARPLAIGLMIVGGIVRATQYLNFAPVGALSLFAGARLRGWQAYLFPIALMAITDPFLGGYSAATPIVYGSFLLSVWIGTHLRNSENPLWIGGAAIAGAVQFFLVTNLAAWAALPQMYPRSLAGVMEAYTRGIPFFWRTLTSDLLYSAVFFGLHAWLSRSVVRSERVAAQTA